MESEIPLNSIDDVSTPAETPAIEQEELANVEQEQTETTKTPEKQTNLDQSVIIEGKRSRKPTLRLELTESVSTKKELVIPQGNGTPLGEIEYINYQIAHASTDALSRMRQICFGRRGTKATVRKNLREFKGFDFDSQSVDYKKHLANLTKLKKEQLRSLSAILGLSSSGRNTDLAEKILNFLMKPVDEGKKIPSKKQTKKRDSKPKENGKDFHFKPGKNPTNKQVSDHEEDLTDANEQQVDSKADEEEKEVPSNTTETLA